MGRLNVNSARCEALFASGLQRSDCPDARAVTQAISRAVRELGTRGCASQMAQEFGDHPETACDRMRWVRQVISETVKSPQCSPARAELDLPASVHASRRSSHDDCTSDRPRQQHH
jgi:hypothetical protein